MDFIAFFFFFFSFGNLLAEDLYLLVTLPVATTSSASQSVRPSVRPSEKSYFESKSVKKELGRGQTDNLITLVFIYVRIPTYISGPKPESNQNLHTTRMPVTYLVIR